MHFKRPLFPAFALTAETIGAGVDSACCPFKESPSGSKSAKEMTNMFFTFFRRARVMLLLTYIDLCAFGDALVMRQGECESESGKSPIEKSAEDIEILAVPLPPQPHERFCQCETKTGPTHESKHGSRTTKGMHNGRSTGTHVLSNKKSVTSTRALSGNVPNRRSRMHILSCWFTKGAGHRR